MGYQPLKYERVVAGTNEAIALGAIEIMAVVVTSENGQICDLTLHDGTDGGDEIAVHLAAEENASAVLTFPSDAPLVLEDGCWAALTGTSGRAFVYYR
jgi:hypothetical protein